MSEEVLERQVFHAGTTFIKESEVHSNAYIIQKGDVIAYVTDEGGSKVISGRYGVGTIIGENNLLIDEPSHLSFEAVVDTTVITVVRQDFEKQLQKVDSTLLQIINKMVSKLRSLERQNALDALEAKKNDDKAVEIVDFLLRDMSGERKTRYEDILLPHFNLMCKALNDLKKEERHIKQKEALEDKVTQIEEGVEIENTKQESNEAAKEDPLEET